MPQTNEPLEVVLIAGLDMTQANSNFAVPENLFDSCSATCQRGNKLLSAPRIKHEAVLQSTPAACHFYPRRHEYQNKSRFVFINKSLVNASC